MHAVLKGQAGARCTSVNSLACQAADGHIFNGSAEISPINEAPMHIEKGDLDDDEEQNKGVQSQRIPLLARTAQGLQGLSQAVQKVGLQM